VAITSGHSPLVRHTFQPGRFRFNKPVGELCATNAGSFSNAVVISSDGGNSTNGLTGIGAQSQSPILSPTHHRIGAVLVSFTDDSTGTITTGSGPSAIIHPRTRPIQP